MNGQEMTRRTPTGTGGFTLIELVIVVAILTIATSVGVRSVDGLMGSRAVVGAQNTFTSFAARARLHAVQSGLETHFVAYASKDSLKMIADGVVVDAIGFQTEMGVDLVIPGDGLKICYDARGIAIPSCNSFSAPLMATFNRGGHSAEVRIHTFGQITRQTP